MMIRTATANDVATMHAIRTRVRENRLSDPSVITEQDYHDFMARNTMGWVCEHDGVMMGFAMVDVEARNVWALFVAPEHEFMGVGRALHETMLGCYWQRQDVLRLSTAPNTRAEAFYRKAGYDAVGLSSSGEVLFEMWRNGEQRT